MAVALSLLPEHLVDFRQQYPYNNIHCINVCSVLDIATEEQTKSGGLVPPKQVFFRKAAETPVRLVRECKEMSHVDLIITCGASALDAEQQWVKIHNPSRELTTETATATATATAETALEATIDNDIEMKTENENKTDVNYKNTVLLGPCALAVMGTTRRATVYAGGDSESDMGRCRSLYF